MFDLLFEENGVDLIGGIKGLPIIGVSMAFYLVRKLLGSDEGVLLISIVLGLVDVAGEIG